MSTLFNGYFSLRVAVLNYTQMGGANNRLTPPLMALTDDIINDAARLGITMSIMDYVKSGRSQDVMEAPIRRRLLYSPSHLCAIQKRPIQDVPLSPVFCSPS